jgi:hypothetical protein
MQRTIRTAKRRQAVLKALAEGGSYTMAANAARLARSSLFAWKAEDAEFATECAEAVEAGTDLLEDEAVRRGRDGVKKPVYQGGKRVGFVQEYSDTLLIVTMKMRGRFVDRQATELTGAGGGPIRTDHTHHFDLSKLDDDELEQLERLAEKSSGAANP